MEAEAAEAEDMSEEHPEVRLMSAICNLDH